ncbi:hypothetical protein GUJ93_ZPchr0008g11677 [Zizania palustris]|uniref:Uncharacterized protein n=1 Tax=Zizania palustris TaxID=103762 RepID=A0A8J5QYT7_ZIZPA|nr:hypothetical protein GUJ93_ZPchr0008g11677 [Zizania palustris]
MYICTAEGNGGAGDDGGFDEGVLLACEGQVRRAEDVEHADPRARQEEAQDLAPARGDARQREESSVGFFTA